MAVASKVLGTYELLENILLHLPLRQLLLAQRVSNAFRDMIINSSKIKNVLFLTSGMDETVEWNSDGNPEKVRRRVSRKGKWKYSATGEPAVILVNPFTQLCASYNRALTEVQC